MLEHKEAQPSLQESTQELCFLGGWDGTFRRTRWARSSGFPEKPLALHRNHRTCTGKKPWGPANIQEALFKRKKKSLYGDFSFTRLPLTSLDSRVM